jgi:Uma2 family endonuclease
MQTLLEKLIQSPRLPQYLQEIESILAQERMKRKAFYEQVEEDKKMEFINGKIIFQSPVKFRHNQVSKFLLRLIDTYVEVQGQGFVGYEKMLVSLTRNDYEPDICYWREEQSRQFKPDQMQFPAPDLVVEVLSAGTEKTDRGIKFEDYAAHGVEEYWIVDPKKQVIEQYINENNEYGLKHKAQKEEVVYCQVIKGFNIPAIALFDKEENLKVLKNLFTH